MKNIIFLLLIIVFSAVNVSTVNAQTDNATDETNKENPVLDALIKQFGNITTEEKATRNITAALAVEYAENRTMDLMNKIISEGQKEAPSEVEPYRNCVSFFEKDYFVQLTTNENCDMNEFGDALSFFKLIGYKHESSYSNILGTTSIQLQTDKMVAED